MELSKANINKLIKGVFDGTISVFELPKLIYSFTLTTLDGALLAGFGDLKDAGVLEVEKAINFRANIQQFSGAKTFQEVKDLTDFVFDENGKKRAFKEFREFAQKTHQAYDVDWLRTEQDSVFSQAQNARKELKFQGEKDIFPMVRYVTVGDDRVRPDHAALNGLTLPVDHPKWDKISPQNGWKCRCIKIQLDDAVATSAKETAEKTKLIEKEFEKSNKKNKFTFDYNPGKVDYIYKQTGKGKHPYFRVPKEFSEAQKNNFGFPNADEVTGVKI